MAGSGNAHKAYEAHKKPIRFVIFPYLQGYTDSKQTLGKKKVCLFVFLGVYYESCTRSSRDEVFMSL